MSELVLAAVSKVGDFPLLRPRLLSLMVVVAIVMAVSLFFVWSRVQGVNMEYEISSLEGQLQSLEEKSQVLRVEAASLRHPGRIERMAMTELGLRPPTVAQVIFID